MNLAALKSFAPEVRRQLLEAVGRKLDFVLAGDTADLRAAAKQVAHLRSQSQANRTVLIERVAYTWFNRLAALRFIDARGWHPFRARVVTSASAAETQPELLKLTRSGELPAELAPFTDPKRLNDLLDGHLPSPDPQGEVYRHLILAACRFYHDLMPSLFEALDDETELLLPDDLLTEHSIAHGFRTEISDEDCGEVELLGWLYQFYISEKKDQVMARKSAVPTEDIPAVTQLFTPHWIVRYLVENSLGRLWLLNRPGSRLREQMPYYIEGEPETDFLKITKPEEIRLLDPAVGSGHMLTYAFDLLTLIYEEEGYAPTEIPALILRHNLYGLEICPRAAQLAELALVFKARGKSRRFFQPEHMVRPNIIELRDVRFTEGELADYLTFIQPSPSGRGQGEGATDSSDTSETASVVHQSSFLKLLHQFEEAKTFGSLIQPCLDEPAIASARRAIEAKDLAGQLFLHETHRKVLRVLDQAEALTQRYHVVVANPPYMGSAGMNSVVKEFATTHYNDSKGDLFAMFIRRALAFPGSRAYIAMVTLQNWMFLSSFEQLRAALLRDCTLITLTQIGFNSFPEMNSKVAQACAFVAKNSSEARVGYYVNLNDAPQSSDKKLVFLEKIRRREFFYASASDFQKIPGTPLAYWAPNSVRATYSAATLLSDFAKPQAGLATGDNSRFQRLWHEIAFSRIGFSAASAGETKQLPFKWYPCNSGGPFRKWYGNAETVVNWENDGAEIRNFFGKNGRLASRPQNTQYYFKRGVTWTKIGSGPFAARFSPGGFVFDDTGRSAFPNDKTEVWYLLGLMCSSAANYFLSLLNPTMSFTSGDVARLPAMKPVNFNHEIPKEAFAVSKAEWDNFETSWDFRDQPLLRCGQWLVNCDGLATAVTPVETGVQENHNGAHSLDSGFHRNDEKQPANPASINSARQPTETHMSLAIHCPPSAPSYPSATSYPLSTTLESCWQLWNSQCTAAIRRMQELETENNRLFIAAYGLEGELQPEVPEKQITLARADARRDMVAFLSYAVGCMMGRYSLDKPGLILADAGATVEDYYRKVGGAGEETQTPCIPLCERGRDGGGDSFAPDVDGIIPILDGEWFEDDIVARTRDFLRATFGDATLEANLHFIEESLGRDLRKYFLTDFYKDHLQTYKKRPIYWLFQSPKKGFSALVYLHRYTKDTANRLLSSYLRDFLHKLRARLEHLDHVMASESTPAREVTKARKESDQLKKTLRECEEYEREILLPLAQQRIELDLDNGVKVNYLKLGAALAPIPGLAAKEDE